MTNNILKETIHGSIKMEVGEWKYITSEYFYSLNESAPLIWNSVDSNIVQVNPNSGLLYAKDVGTTTVFATGKDETQIKVFCSIEVKATELSVSTKDFATKSSSIATTSCGTNDTDTSISAMGYSGTVFAYTIVGRNVTLEKGFASRSGTANEYSRLFHAKLVEMNNIYASMSTIQRQAWMCLRMYGFIDSVKDYITADDMSDIAENIAKEMLTKNGIDLGTMLEATLLSLYRWYLAEEDAVVYYYAF